MTGGNNHQLFITTSYCHVSVRLIEPQQKQHVGPLEARLITDMRTHIYARIRLHIPYSIFGKCHRETITHIK